MKKRICMLLVVAVLLGMFPMAVRAAETKSSVSIWNYGYSSLSEDEKRVYQLIENCIINCDSGVEVDYFWGISTDQLMHVVEMVSADHPEYFWFTGSYNYTHYADIAMGFYPNYAIGGKSVSKTEILKAASDFESATNHVLNQMNQEAGSDEYAKAVWLHDKVAQLVTYEYGPNHQTAYGALLEGKAVCSGYAKLYQHLLKRAGISAFMVRGTSINPASGSSERHAWTLMWLDGKCVYSDVTWDDQGESLFHVYFARSFEDISIDHTADASYLSMLPVCKCDNYGYFDVYSPKNKITGTMSANIVTNLAVPNSDGRSWSVVLYDPTGTNVMNWIQNSGEIWSVIQNFGYGSYSVTARSLGSTEIGQEIHLTFVNKSLPAGITVSGTVTSFLSDSDSISVLLIKDGAPIYQTQIKGKTASYCFTEVPSGVYTMRIEKNSHVTLEMSINVGTSNVTANAKLVPVGDASGDGKLNMKDWNQMYEHLNEVSVLTGYGLQCADATGDGKVNMKDWNRLYEHLSETNPLW